MIKPAKFNHVTRLGVFFALNAICIGPSAFAQDFEVSPVVINFEVEPGGIATQKVLIRNHANTAQHFEFKLGDYEVDEHGSKKRLPPGTSPKSCSDWISVNPSFLELKPNEETEVNVIMAVPKSGTDTRWGIIYVQAATERTSLDVDKNVAAGVLLKPRIAVFVSQSPKSNTNWNGKLERLHEVPNARTPTLRTFEVQVNNTGDKMLEARVYLVLADVNTGEEKKYPETKKTMVPGSKSVFKLSIPKEDIKAGKKYALAAVMDYGHRSALEAVQIMIE
ncbi:MAG: hypothetical protein H6585_10460 [Flavobacteriales bacterium]|nr:hypothetical protein [Flavobacteriales bacterium]MCB9448754.1 hypothetical protein [Flavobacteriales bacterium]